MIKTTLAAVILLALPMSAIAASFSISPASGSYTVGDTIRLTVNVSPEGTPIYTAMLDARFATDVFEIVSFTLNDSMLPLRQSGYDALDNNGGVLTKTGGYTGGVNATTFFGTVVLRAKSAGSGNFTVVDNSKLLDSSNVDRQSGAQVLTFIVSAPAVVEVQPQESPVARQTATIAQNGTPAAESSEDEPLVDISSATSSTDETSAQVASAAGTASSYIWLLGILIAAMAFAGGYILGRKRIF